MKSEGRERSERGRREKRNWGEGLESQRRRRGPYSQGAQSPEADSCSWIIRSQQSGSPSAALAAAAIVRPVPAGSNDSNKLTAHAATSATLTALSEPC